LSKTTRYQLAHDRALTQRILNRVQDLENEGYEFEAAEASFDLLVQKEAGIYSPCFERLAYRVNIEADASGRPTTEATVKLRVGDQLMHTVSEGDGPVNALDSALRKALLGMYPRLSEMHLVDYKVRVVNARAETAARVRVVIEWRDGNDTWGTVGVSENVVEASWLALADAVEYKVCKDRGALSPAAPQDVA
jgi:2-isopropylmalate synthase